MSDQSRLARRYRRLLACYPSAFRREHEDEMLAVLLACARDGQRHPGIADTANVLCHALWSRIVRARSRSAAAPFWGVTLILLTAFLNLVAIAVVIASKDAVDATVLRHIVVPVHEFPGGGSEIVRITHRHLAAQVYGLVASATFAAPIAAVGWVALSWLTVRRRNWGRAGVVVMFVLSTVSVVLAAGRHAATYAPADLIAGIAVCVSALAAAALILSTDSGTQGRLAA